MVLGRAPNVQDAEICCGLLLNDFVSYCSYHFIIYIIKTLCLAWMYSGILILVGSVELESDFLKDGSIMIPSCENSKVICSNCRWHPNGFISHYSMPATCPPNVAFNPLQARSILSAGPISRINAARYLNFVQAFRKTDCLHTNMTQDAIHGCFSAGILCRQEEWWAINVNKCRSPNRLH